MKVINLQRVVFKDTWKSEVEKMTWQSILPKFNCNSKWYSVVYVAPACLYACLAIWAHVPDDEADGVQGDILPHLDLSVTELRDSLRCNAASNAQPKSIEWLDLGWAIMGASRWYDLLHSLGIACIQTATWGHALLCTFSSLHKGADAGAADGLGSFYDPVQLS